MRVFVAVVAAAIVVPAAAAAAAPQVRLLPGARAAVAGSGFHPRERVVVTVSSGSARLREAVRVSAAGTFVARFARAVPRRPCAAVAVVAVGAGGERAAWKSPPQECGAPPAGNG